ncbi:ATP-grasp domain-containing protein [Trueperella bialowiezensis]|uniref:Glutathione synthase/Ribosomal protein S6 modification enzyme (Glutaminyl transferase) n=1 Tax=Trueperella bialowiezensis TaxID=312285 RepID=A0A3S4WFJ5_9ACTO|nr:glutathione synthetase [Trueperella bialowiezensis]VEI12749.1 Glutathione synthase/Ribosomal protein S6 modification enzyme (glutaminyl transferase) [Trueperella bialowiezensis]
MSEPKVFLATSEFLPNLDQDEQDLPDALRDRGIEPVIAVWNDPSVDWSAADLVVVRSVRDYARYPKEFNDWAKSIPRIANSAPTMEWNMDKHYMQDFEKLGLPIVPTTWLEPEDKLTKQQIHSRFPSHGDFVIKPAVSSGGRGTGRYTATDAKSRSDAILHAQYELEAGRSVMVQRYLEDIEISGETSLIYLNGLSAYSVQKEPMLHPRYRNPRDSGVMEEIARSAEASEESWRWGERIRLGLHQHIKNKTGRDELLLFNRVDIVRGAPDSPEEFYIMEISLIDGSLYLSANPEHLNRFADAIQMRAFL